MKRPYILAIVFCGACGARSSLDIPTSGSSGSGGSPPDTCGTEGVVTLVSGKYATSHQVPGGFAIDSTHVYWIDVGDPGERGSIRRVPKCGGTPETLATGILYPGNLALDDSYVFYNDIGDSGHSVMGGIFKVPKAGGAATQLASEYNPLVLTIDASNVYWAGVGLEAMPKTGGTVTHLSDKSGQSIAVDDHYVYWFAAGITGPNMTPLTRISKTGGTPQVFSGPSGIHFGLAVDATSAFVGHRLSFETGELLRFPLDGGAPSTLASTTVTSMTLDATHVYWTDNDGGLANQGSVKKIAKSGGSIVTIASGESSAIEGIAVDDTHVFWLDDREVRRAPK